ncbi:MAG TPA: FAD-binding oxidoreductase [Longimicrobium sp.]
MSEPRPAVPGGPAPLAWRVATVRGVSPASAHARTLVLDVPAWPGHRAGQHVDVRLVAEDGYQAQRSYSIASAPEDTGVSLTVERLDDGEVSPYLTDVLRPGDGLEVRGPIGGYFAWDVVAGGPLLLVGGGSGVVPLLAMLRHRAHAGAAARARVPARLIYSARTLEAVIDRADIERLEGATEVDVVLTLTRETGMEWTGRRGRVDRGLLAEAGWPPSAAPRAFVCGPTPFVEAVATMLVELGHEPRHVRTERFGPTG